MKEQLLELRRRIRAALGLEVVTGRCVTCRGTGNDLLIKKGNEVRTIAVMFGPLVLWAVASPFIPNPLFGIGLAVWGAFCFGIVAPWKELDTIDAWYSRTTTIEDAIEELAALEHDQWNKWSQDIAAKESLSPERVERWKALWVPYSELSEEMKEHDRKWARKVIEILKGAKHG